MKSLIILAFVCISLCVSGQSTASIHKEQVPRTNAAILSFQDVNHDFGDVLEGKKITHIFEYKNIGKDTIRITKVNCGKVCSVTETYDAVLPPGATGHMIVEFDTDNKLGYTTKKMVISYSSGSAGTETEITLNVQANIIVKM